MIKRLNHIGITADNFDKVVKKFAAYGLPSNEIIQMEDTGAKMAFAPIGDTLIEFLSRRVPGKGGWSPTYNYPGVINHLCFEVDNLEASINDFEKAGAKVVEGCPKAGGHGRIAFFYPETTENVLIELCELL